MSGAGGRSRGEAARYHVSVETQVVRVEVDGAAARLEGLDGEARVLEEGPGPSFCLSVGDRRHRVFGVRLGESAWEIHHRGRSFRVEVADERTWRLRQARGNATRAAGDRQPLRAPMPGLVLRLDVEAGEEVERGQRLLIVEAMKMENELRARAAGRVRRVHVSTGESVRRGDTLIEFEPDAGAGPAHVRGDSGAGTEP